MYTATKYSIRVSLVSCLVVRFVYKMELNTDLTLSQQMQILIQATFLLFQMLRIHLNYQELA